MVICKITFPYSLFTGLKFVSLENGTQMIEKCFPAPMFSSCATPQAAAARTTAADPNYRKISCHRPANEQQDTWSDLTGKDNYNYSSAEMNVCFDGRVYFLP